MNSRFPRRAIAQRQGRPAHENAPPRLRASTLDRRFIPEIERQQSGGVIAKLIAMVRP